MMIDDTDRFREEEASDDIPADIDAGKSTGGLDPVEGRRESMRKARDLLPSLSPPNATRHDPPPGLTERARATHEELRRIDRHLAGLFELGHQLAARATDDGVAYLLAHAGRELSRGVVAAFAGQEEGRREDSAEDLKDTQKNRSRIAAVLQRPTEHASVSLWFKLVNTFARSCHFQPNAPDSAEVRRAFEQLAGLLYGRVGLFFETSAVLDALAAKPDPTDADAQQASSLLARPQQRRHFFGALQHPAWIPLLAARGHFGTPPGRLVDEDGSWRMQAWPEGEYLARMAPLAPDEVTARLVEVPHTVDNPLVWGMLVDAALSLPIPYAGTLARRVAKALQVVPAVYLPHKAVDLLAHLVTLGDTEALRLLEALLWTRGEEEGYELEAKQGAGGRRFAHGVRSTQWVLARLDAYELGRVCSAIVPKLAQLDAARTLEILTNALERSVRLLVPADDGDGREFSQHWCRDLEGHDRDGDVRALLARAVARCAVVLASQGAESARRAYELLPADTMQIGRRLRWHLLAHAGASLIEELDAVVGGEDLLDPPFGKREAGRLLRGSFMHASPPARDLFRYAIERGPSPERVASLLRWRAELRDLSRSEGGANENSDVPVGQEPNGAQHSLGNTGAVQEAVRDWQRQCLRLFHERLPDDLKVIAVQVGHEPAHPTIEEQSLDEDGFSTSTSAGWGGPPSPKSPEELTAMEPKEVVALLRDWTLSDGRGGRDSRHSLEEAVREFATRAPDRGTAALEEGAAAGLRQSFLAALVVGLKKAMEAKLGLPWPRLLSALRAALVSTEESIDPSIPADTNGLPSASDAQVMRDVASILTAAAAENTLPQALAEDAWAITREATQSVAMNSEPTLRTSKGGVEAAFNEALNCASGDAVRLVVELGLWDFRRRELTNRETVQKERQIPEVEALVAPLFDVLVALEGRPGTAALTMLGHLLPHVQLLAPDWMRRQEQALLGNDGDNEVHPAWAAYLAGGSLFTATFERFRPQYVRTARLLPAIILEPKDAADDDYSVPLGLASHVLTVVLWGRAALGDADALVETTFARVPPAQRAKAYWQVFRAWSDAEDPPPADVVERLVAFWRWRVTALEMRSESAERTVEGEGLLWFLKMPYVPAADAINLGIRTVSFGPFGDRLTAGAWERLVDLMGASPDDAFELLEVIIFDQLRATYAYLPFDEVAPSLRLAMTRGGREVRERAVRLVHQLGDQGHFEFGELLRTE